MQKTKTPITCNPWKTFNGFHPLLVQPKRSIASTGFANFLANQSLDNLPIYAQNMTWKVAQAWTSILPQEGYRHFRVMLKGGKGQERWVELEAVLDSNVRRRVAWKELQNKTVWMSGWRQLPPAE